MGFSEQVKVSASQRGPRSQNQLVSSQSRACHRTFGSPSLASFEKTLPQ